MDKNQIILIGALVLAFITLWVTVLTSTPMHLLVVTTKKSPRQVLWNIANVMDPEPVGLWLALGSTLWGVFVASNFGTTTALPYDFPDNILGLVMGVLGLLMLLAIGFDLHRTYSFASFGLMLMWAFVAWSAATLSSGHSSAWIVYAWTTLAIAWVWVRLRWDDSRLQSYAGLD